MGLKGALFSIFKEIFQTALISLGIFLFVNIFLIQPHRVKGDSMYPNFHDGELLLTEKVTYYLYKPQRGDVIVFESPSNKKVDFIKRIVGLPGENVRIEKGFIYIDSQKIDEPYVDEETKGQINKTLGDNQYFVMGDNRGSSSDSRSFGPIDKGSIKGKAWLVYWPIFKSKQSEGFRTVSKINYGISDTFYDK